MITSDLYNKIVNFQDFFYYNQQFKRPTHCINLQARSEFVKHCSRAQKSLKIIYTTNFQLPDVQEKLEPLDEFLRRCAIWRQKANLNNFANLDNNQRSSYWSEN